jgi:transcription elongation GreA/GreB family factor
MNFSRKKDDDIEILEIISAELNFRCRPVMVHFLQSAINTRISEIKQTASKTNALMRDQRSDTAILREELSIAQSEIETLLKDREWLRSRIADFCERYVVELGDHVTVRKIKENRKLDYKIVRDAKEPGEVSLASPFAKAIMGREVGEEFDVQTEKKNTHYILVRIEKHEKL